MARLLVCDACGKQEPEELKVEWTHLSLAKLDHPTAPFQKDELCPDCTTSVRGFLARAAGQV